MLTLENVSYSYRKGKEVIRNFSMSLEPGTVCGLLGRNGVGKSTLLYLICGLLKADFGRIDFNGFNPLNRKPEFLSDAFIVPEEFSLPNVTVEEFVRVNAPFYPKFNKKEMDDYMITFDLDPAIHLGRCSMGQKKKAFISFALACNTSLLLLDEPTNGLDITAKRAFRKATLMHMNDEKTILISTHQVYDVEKILDHVIIVDNGGELLNASMLDVTNKLNFSYSTDRERIENALIALDAVGGMHIVEYANPDDSEQSDVNLESLYELAQRRPDVIRRLFPRPSAMQNYES